MSQAVRQIERSKKLKYVVLTREDERIVVTVADNDISGVHFRGNKETMFKLRTNQELREYQRVKKGEGFRVIRSQSELENFIRRNSNQLLRFLRTPSAGKMVVGAGIVLLASRIMGVQGRPFLRMVGDKFNLSTVNIKETWNNSADDSFDVKLN